MKSLYAFLALLSFLSLLFHATVSVAPDPESRAFIKLCLRPQTWDLVFRDGLEPIPGQTPEAVKADLMHFASVYRSRAEIRLAAGMLISLVIFVFSAVGWFRERQFNNRLAAVSSGAIAGLPS